MNIKARFTSEAAYRAHLERMWGFCTRIEQRIGTLLDTALPDHDNRSKLPLLSSDLIALGATTLDIERLPRCEALVACKDTSAAFGCAYVMEGATLGGRTLLSTSCGRLGVTAERGARFFASYGDETASRWRVFGAALETWCNDAMRTRAATLAAVATFEMLEIWLCDPPM